MAIPISSREHWGTSSVAFFGSLITHAVLAWLILTNLNSCGKQGEFGQSTEYREVGLYVIDDTIQEKVTESEATQASEIPLPELPENLQDALRETQPAMPAVPELPAIPLIGPGMLASPVPSEGPHSAFQASPMLPPMTTSGVPTTTRFFDINTDGQAVVYLIDCSGSMSKHNAFRYAKAELLASLERLDPQHKFQILFYNEQTFEFRDRQGEVEIHWATAANLTRARTFISQMDNTGGTSHYPALMKALSYSPEVIFFLSDAAEPALSAKELDEIQRKNRGKTAIHCIEFGLGPDLNLENFLKKMSRQNGGSYRYRDMSQLGL